MSKTTRGRPARGKYLFDGEYVSANQLKTRGMVYRLDAIRAALKVGCSTMPELISHIERVTAEGRMSASKKGASNFNKPQFGLGKEMSDGTNCQVQEQDDEQ